MIKTNPSGRETLGDIRKREADEKEKEQRALCEEAAIKLIGSKEKLIELSNKHKGLWYLPAFNEDGTIDKLAIMKPIDRHILSHASTKLEDEGLYTFLEQCMRECWVDGDEAILDDDEYFIPAAMKFNKIMEGKKVAFLKR